MKKSLQIIFILFLAILKLDAFERTVLTEIFTSTTCPPCATQNPYFDSWLKNYSNKDRVAVIKYHTWWPSPGNDPFYHANVTENRGRTNYYSTNYVPRGIINGTSDGSSSASTWIVLIQNSINSTSQFDIKILGNVDSELGGNLTIKVTADNNAIPSGTLVLHVAVVESEIYYTGTNGDPVHNFVMRKMYPDHNGEIFTINPNETKTFTRVFSWNTSWKLDKSHVVAFIQNQSTKEVYQASIRRANIYLAAPSPIYPPDNSLNQPINVTLSWNKISNAINYGLEVATDSLFNNKIFSDTTLVDTFKTLVKLAKETWYYWRVKAISSYAISDWSSTYRFKTLPLNLPSQVQLVYPEDQALFINPTGINFIWLKSEPDVDLYKLEIGIDSGFINKVIDTTLTDTNTVLMNLYGRFYWQVTARNGMGWGLPSQRRSFSVFTASVEDELLPLEFKLFQNFPNPFNSKTKIVFTIPQSMISESGSNKITLSIYDLLGREIATLFDGEITAGKYEVEFDAEKINLSGGIYFYQLRLGEISKIKKLVYLK